MGTYCSVPLSSQPWYASFFIDPGVKWCRVQSGDMVFVYAVPWLSLAFLVIRAFFERKLAGPLGLYLNVPDKNYNHPQYNAVLNKAYQKCPCPDPEKKVIFFTAVLGLSTLLLIQQLSYQVGWTYGKVERWFVKSRDYGRPSKLAKFRESSWRLLVYAFTSIYGTYYLCQEDFFWELAKCYEGFPANTPSRAVLGIWTFQTALYLSFLITHERDVRRKDYWPMFLHHILSVVLLGVSYMLNGVQIAVMITLTHDYADIFLELAKLFNYARYELQAQITFLLFGTLFSVTRMIVLPFFLIRSAILDYPVIVSHSPAWWITIFMLVVLQVLHVYWFGLLLRMMKALVTNRKLVKDIRSDSETNLEVEFEDECNHCVDSKLRSRSTSVPDS